MTIKKLKFKINKLSEMLFDLSPVRLKVNDSLVIKN